MLRPSPAEAGPSSNDQGRGAGRGGPRPLALAVGSALLLWVSFPPAGWWWFGWVALAPLFLLVVDGGPPGRLYAAAWAGGMAFWTLAIQWVRLTDPTAWLAWLVMALALSLFSPLFLGLCRLAVRGLGLPLMVAAPTVWVALEYVRAYAVTGFPWYYLAHSQHEVLPVIQISDLTGSLGVSAVVALVNAWLVDLLTLPLLRPTPRGPRLTRPQAVRLAAVALVVGGTLAYGGYRVNSAVFGKGPRVALVQSNFVQRYKESKKYAEIAATYYRLTQGAAKADPKPDLIVWPETSYPYGYVAIEPGLDDPALDAQLKALGTEMSGKDRRRQGDEIAADLHNWTDALNVPMVVGSLTYDHRREKLSRYNSAILFEPGVKTVQSFHKIHLVPFGEYVPLIETFPWLVALTPYHGTHVPSLTFGREPSWMDLGPYRLAAAICFEDTVPQVARRFFHEAPDGRHPDVLLNLSNDGWFHTSSEHEMHLAVSVFRAVENRVPLARAANTGVSAVVDGNGRVRQSLATGKEGVLAGEVPLDGRSSLYTRWGDWLGQACLAVTIGLPPLAAVWPRWRRSWPTRRVG